MEQNKRPTRKVTGSYPGVTGSYRKPTRIVTPAQSSKEPQPQKEVTPPKSEAVKAQSKPKDSASFDFKMWFSKDNVRAFFKQFGYYGAIVLASLLLTIGIVTVSNDIFSFVKPDNSVVVSIAEGSSTMKIAKALKKAGVIKHPFVFNLYSKLKKADGKFQFGDYSLNSNLGYDQIISMLKKSSVEAETVTFTITAGSTQDEIMEMLTSNKFFDYTELDQAFNEYKYDDFEFIAEIPERRCRLEGYFIPGDYEMSKGESAISVTTKLLTKFKETVLTEENENLITQTGLSVDEIVTFASLLQSECGSADMYKTAASVIYNRLRGQVPMNLALTSPINYILPQPKSQLDVNDKNIEDSYNTYVNQGLPTGPVCTPSNEAIAAVLSPETSSYLYFISDNTTAYYASTVEEHDKNLEKASKSAKGTNTIR